MVAFVKVTFFRSTLQGALSHRKPTSAGIFRDSCSRVILNGKTKAFGKKKNCVDVTLITSNSTWVGLGRTLCLRGEIPTEEHVSIFMRFSCTLYKKLR